MKVDQRVIPPVVEQLLKSRGMDAAAMPAFLWPDYDQHLHDPFLLTDMEAAVARLVRAQADGERVAIYGDYDIDGLTATSLLLDAFGALGIKAEGYIPDRFEEGYGINQAALAKLQQQGFSLVVSVDCGVTSVAEADWARQHGLDLIITDHHAVPEVLPQALAVINPKRPGDDYPFKDLAGVGVAFKLAQALQTKLPGLAPGREKWLLDLVALGSVCDIVNLVGENRVLVTYGLRVVRQTRRPGLAALADVAGLQVDSLSAQHLSFGLGPRLNATGRLEHAARGLELLTTTDTARATELAAELDGLNRQRRRDQEAIVAGAAEQAEQYDKDPVLVLSHPDWSHGIVGIAASKLVEQFHKPTLILQQMGDVTKGSARSVGDFNMVEALRSVAPLLTKFGGHFYAAGLTLPTDNVPALRQGLNDYFATSGSSRASRRSATAEVELEAVTAADWQLLEELELLEPYGAGNPQPLVGLKALTLDRVEPLGRDGKHYRLRLTDGTGGVTAVAFGWAERLPDLAAGQSVDVCLELSRNLWQGQERLQLLVRELVVAELEPVVG